MAVKGCECGGVGVVVVGLERGMRLVELIMGGGVIRFLMMMVSSVEGLCHQRSFLHS